MLWRAGYTPEVRTHALVPRLEIQPPIRCIAGCFGPQDYRDIDIWRRLFESAGFDYRLICPPELTEMFPPSIASKLSPVGELRPWLDAVGSERVFAFVKSDGPTPLLVIGPPTEDVWAKFESLVRELSAS